MSLTGETGFGVSLVDALFEAQTGTGTVLRDGIVAAVSPLTVIVPPSTVASPAAKLDSYRPVVGDFVQVLVQGANRLVVGSVGAGTVGRVAGAEGSVDQNGIATTFTVITGLTMTFTAVAGRRYVLHYTFGVNQLTATASQVFNWTLAGAAQAIVERMNPTPIGLRTVAGFKDLGVLGAGSKTIGIGGTTSAGTMNFPHATLIIGRSMIVDVGT